jgi:hypothetical protein
MAFSDFETDSAGCVIDLLGAETVTYYPTGGEARTISAIVDREEAASLPGSTHGTAPGAEISVLNNATTGISTSELNKTLDKISYPVRIGETAQARKIVAIVSQDAGMLTLRVA